MRLRVLVLLALCGALTLHALHFFQPVDDAFISFRYAENLAAGRGLVFNPGEKVEGYSNFLWVLLLAAARLLGADVPAASRALGIFFSIATLLAAAAVARRLLPGRKSAGLPAALLLAASPAVAMWAGGGMEVPLFSFLALTAASLWMRESDRETWPWRWPLAACLAALARPDGVLLFGITAGRDLLGRGEAAVARRKRALAALGVFALPGIPYFLWRWSYYGALLPNTYYAKVSYDTAVLTHGLDYLWWFLVDSGGAAIVLGALLAVRPRDRRVALLLWQGAGFASYVLLLGGDGYAFSRFLVPVAVLLAPAAEFGYRRAWGWLSSRLQLRPAGAAVVATVLLLAVAGAASTGSFAGADFRNYLLGAESVARRRAIGQWLRRTARPGSLLALNPVGIIPYFSGLPTLDLLGLTDAHIARRGERVTNRVLYAHNRFDPAYVLSRRPDYLILGQATTLDVDPNLQDLTRPGRATFEAIAPAVARDFRGFPGDERIWGLPAFRRLYTPNIARLGKSYFYYFTLDGTAVELEKLVGAGRDTGADHARLALDLAAKGEMGLALEEAGKAEKLDPAQEPLRRKLEESGAAAGKARESRNRVLAVLQRMEEDLARGDPASGEADLLAGLKNDPEHPLLLYSLGTLYEQMERPEEAMQAYLRALKARPDFADACNNVGTLYARRGDLKRAREYWERAVAADPNNAAAQNLLKLRQMEGKAPP